jgi:hypothetical protein
MILDAGKLRIVGGIKLYVWGYEYRRNSLNLYEEFIYIKFFYTLVLIKINLI